jgi:hypothetical protein
VEQRIYLELDFFSFYTFFTQQYSAHATAKGAGRNGEATSGNLSLRLAMPKELGGMGNGSNPEQLFAMGYSGIRSFFFPHIFDFFRY